MTDLARLRVVLSGPAVPGGGLATFYASDTGASLPTAVKSFYSSLAASTPSNCTWTIPNSGDLINEATGAITGSWTGSGGGSVSGSGGGAYVMGTGVRIRWGTAGIVAGRRVRGATFIIPLLEASITGDGQVDEGFRTGLTGWGTTLITAMAGALTVWSRPTATRSGTHHDVTVCDVPDRVSWLRSRRL